MSNYTEEDLARMQVQQGQQQLDQDPGAVQASYMREERVNNILSQINPDNLMTDIEHRIRGEKKDPFTMKWIPIVDNPKPISEKLIGNFMSFLGSILNQNVSMSNFSSDEINKIMDLIISYIGHDLTLNDEVYGIKGDYAEMWRIANIVAISCFATFKQAQNGMLAKRVFQGLSLKGDIDPASKDGLVEALKFWK